MEYFINIISHYPHLIALPLLVWIYPLLNYYFSSFTERSGQNNESNSTNQVNNNYSTNDSSNINNYNSNNGFLLSQIDINGKGNGENTEKNPKGYSLSDRNLSRTEIESFINRIRIIIIRLRSIASATLNRHYLDPSLVNNLANVSRDLIADLHESGILLDDHPDPSLSSRFMFGSYVAVGFFEIWGALQDIINIPSDSAQDWTEFESGDSLRNIFNAIRSFEYLHRYLQNLL